MSSSLFHPGVGTGFWDEWRAKDFIAREAREILLALHPPNLQIEVQAVTFHCYFLTYKDN